MALKKTEATNMTAASEPKLKPVKVELPNDVHLMLRKLAAHHNASMAAYTRETVEQMIREEFKRKGLK